MSYKDNFYNLRISAVNTGESYFLWNKFCFYNILPIFHFLAYIKQGSLKLSELQLGGKE